MNEGLWDEHTEGTVAFVGRREANGHVNVAVVGHGFCEILHEDTLARTSFAN